MTSLYQTRIQPNGPEYAKVVVIGFGATGQSVIRYLSDSTAELIAMDTRELPPNKKELKKRFPNARLVTGGLDQYTLETADLVVVSPGVALSELGLEQFINPNAEVVGDIELFARVAAQPVAAITGSNGKSTVATLVNLMINASGKRALLGGNIGTPALDLLAGSEPDAYVLELSSFQLETTQSLRPNVATVLNVSEDHLDRYRNFDHYLATKMTIYQNAEVAVVNRDDTRSAQLQHDKAISFGLNPPSTQSDFGLEQGKQDRWLVKGDQRLLAASAITLMGDQNLANVLAALAMVDALGIDLDDAVLSAAASFGGLIDRCEVVAKIDGVTWINDSKGTNVGATLAAIQGFNAPKVLILGGQGKGADFSPLREVIDESVRLAILIGEDADKIEQALQGQVEIQHAESLDAALDSAQDCAQAGDVVLFSPACASFDQFDNYAARGEAFRQAVRARSNG